MDDFPLRLLFVPGEVHDDFTVSPPTLWEIVSVPEEGIERIRGYIATARQTFKDRPTPYFSQRSCPLRAVTVYEWYQRTGERLTNDLEPVQAERRA